MSEENRREANDGRQPKDIKGLLRFCMEATRGEDAPGSNEILEPMTEERKKWLEEALTNMTVNPVERLSICLTAIEEAEVDTEEGTNQQIHSLTELQDWTEDMDIAGDFIRLNGLRIVPNLLSSEVSELRWRCLELLGNMSQNNRVAQTALLNLKLMPVMLQMIDCDANPTVKVKALYAVSCLVRSNVDAQKQLLESDGLPVIGRALHGDDDRLKMKAAFLMSTICKSNPALKDALVEEGAVEKLVSFLKAEDHCQAHEHVMSALLTIVTNHAGAHEKCVSEELDLKTFLCQRIKFLDGKEEFLEEKEYAEELLKALNQAPSTQPSSSNRNNMAIVAL